MSTRAPIGHASGPASDEMAAANKELADANKRLSALRASWSRLEKELASVKKVKFTGLTQKLQVDPAV